MDQKISTTDLTKLAMTAMSLSVAKNGAKTASADGQFQKLLAQRSKPVEKPADKPADNTNVSNKQQDQESVEQPTDKEGNVQQSGDKAEQTDVKESDTPVEQVKQEDPLEQAKRLAELGAAFFQPEEGAVWISGDIENGEVTGVFGPEEFIVAVTTDGQQENIPIVDLEPQQMEQLQQIVGDLQTLASAEDPEADAILEATDPTVDHSPAKLLEKIVDEQTGKSVEETTEEVLTVVPQNEEEEDEDIQVDLLDVEHGQEQVFHDVKAAPVKVGETYEPQQAEDVNQQIAAQILPAVEQGETKVELQLTPEHLGSVKVEITQTENGSLHIAITAENSQTRNLLEKSSNNLQSLLASRSQNEVRVEVQRQEEAQQQHNNYDGHNSQHQQQQQHQRPHTPENSQDFLHQLRLGLVDESWES